MAVESSQRMERRVLRFTAGSALAMALLLGSHELARSSRLFGWSWAAQPPPFTDLLVCVVLLLVLQLGISTSAVLFADHHLVSPRMRKVMTLTYAYFALLSTLTLSLKFFDPRATALLEALALVGWMSALPLTGYQISRYLGIYRKIEVHLEHERELSTQLFRHTTTDPLTGLPNRLLFNDRLGRALARAARTQKPVAVFFINVDRFRHVNDLLGHEIGDRVLQSIAGRLSEGLRTADAVCRVAGDEFLAFATEIGEAQIDVPRVADRLCEELSRPIRVAGHEVSSTVSVGAAVFPHDGADLATLAKHAEQAMQSAKALGRNGHSLYHPEMQESADARVVLETQLRHGLTRGELFLEYQPQIDSVSGKVVGAEALVRWLHPERGILPPAEFISVAEDSSLIVALDRWVLRTACAQLAQWRRLGFEGLRISVNLSAKHFYREDLPETVARILADFGVPGTSLDLEITESTLMSEAPSAVEVLKRLKTMGVTVGIDDFGTGYSSLGYLNRFPVDGLKIDRSLVSDVRSNAGAAAIASAVVAIGRSLNLRVVAEGVETEAQLLFLQGQGCDLVQGFLYSRPLAPPAFEGLLRGPERVPLQLPVARAFTDVS